MTLPDLHFVVPGSLEQRTGGYLYDARMVGGLRELGWDVRVTGLAGSFPDPDESARAALSEALASPVDGSRVVVDGLAMGGLPGVTREHAPRLRLLSLVHHPLAEETGLSAELAGHLERSEREALAACRGVIVTSAFTAGRLRAYDVPPSRIRTVPPGTARARPAEGPGPDQPPRLVCVASVTRRKGHDVLVAALERVRDLDWTCVCAGSLERDPPYVRAVHEQITAAGLGDRIHFVGEGDECDLDQLYHAGSIFVLASYYEGYGMALAEALARGLPIVSTTGGAIPHTVPADAAVLVEPGDADAFADALGSLLSGPPERLAALASAARRHASHLPTWEQSIQAFASAIEALTG